ncbi:unnamed protein product [Cylicocyclus nassatus]|uniref:Uncharacterized protein n=1 Tax=Cylicocyclus nassatus TaxID=53992 RepID=A0AA36DNA6_CYLNA|nr:unnamed protein product [Cylicocyclus nassatus]
MQTAAGDGEKSVRIGDAQRRREIRAGLALLYLLNCLLNLSRLNFWHEIGGNEKVVKAKMKEEKRLN